MTDLDPLGPLEVERRILALSDTLTEITEDVETAAKDEARTDAAWRKAKAKAKLTYEFKRAEVWRSLTGTIPEREAEALLRCRAEYEAMVLAEHGDTYERKRMAEAVFRSCRESGENVRTQLEALRSVNANARDRVFHPTGRGG